jgi:dipeptide transport system substrate-binding protein
MKTLIRIARPILAATVIGGCALGAQAATTFIYCSEGSPEGFDPGRYTAGTTFNASSQAIFNRLVEFEIGGRALEHQPRWPGLHLPAAQGREVPHHRVLQAHA